MSRLDRELDVLDIARALPEPRFAVLEAVALGLAGVAAGPSGVPADDRAREAAAVALARAVVDLPPEVVGSMLVFARAFRSSGEQRVLEIVPVVPELRALDGGAAGGSTRRPGRRAALRLVSGPS